MVLKKKILVAVYGTLRRGFGNYMHYLSKEKYIGQYETDPIYTMYSLGAFPGVVKNGQTSIVMEVFEIDTNKLASLDGLEGYRGMGRNNMYNREKIKTPYGDAFTYIYNNKHTDGLEEVESGDWKEYKKLEPIRALIK